MKIFDWVFYLYKYPDLKNNIFSKEDAYNHYIKYGIDENRQIYDTNILLDIFDYNYYSTNIIKKNINLDDKEYIIQHWIDNTNIDNRIFYLKEGALEDFDWEKYVEDYDDVKNVLITRNDVIKHYLCYGIYEERLYFKKNIHKDKSYDFNYEFYIDFYNDLKKNNIDTEQKAYNHYINYGKKEMRVYSNEHKLLFKNYDWNKYIQNNIDLQKNGINNIRDAYLHYINYGKKEKRQIYEIFINFYFDFYIKFNNFKNISSLDEAIEHYSLLNNKKNIYYSYEDYLIYNIIDWKYYITKNNLTNINNNKEAFIYYINEGINNKVDYFNLNLKFLGNNNNEFISLLFYNIDFFKKIINKNIVNNKNNDFMNQVLYIKKYLENNNIKCDNILYSIPFYDLNTFYECKNDFTFCFVIPSYNNSDNIYNNLLSIFYQNYKNWHIIYTNDNSSDDTESKFNKIVDDYNVHDKIIYIKNDVKMCQSYSKYNSYHMVNDNEIVIILDGDDWLSTNNALNIINEVYLIQKCLIAYSGYKIYNGNNTDISLYYSDEYPDEVKINSSYRTYQNWHFSHVRTGFAYLFKQIPKEYLMYEGKWLDRCTDWAEMFSVAELASDKIKHINQILHIYNKQNSLLYPTSYYNDMKNIQRKNIENHIRSLPPLKIYLPNIYIISLESELNSKEILIDQFSKLNITNYKFFNAINGYTDNDIKTKYDEYIEKYDNKIIPNTVLGVTKKHINNVGALGLIYSTLKLFKHINDTTDLDHVLILEDDIYIHKNFHKLYFLKKTDLIDKDIIYLGFNSLHYKLVNKTNIIELSNDKNIMYLYGTYSYICSRKFRDFILNLGVEIFINYNSSIDMLFNILRCTNLQEHIKNDLKFYSYKTHLFIPEVRKDGINNKRGDEFYKDRNIDINNYLI